MAFFSVISVGFCSVSSFLHLHCLLVALSWTLPASILHWATTAEFLVDLHKRELPSSSSTGFWVLSSLSFFDCIAFFFNLLLNGRNLNSSEIIKKKNFCNIRKL